MFCNTIKRRFAVLAVVSASVFAPPVYSASEADCSARADRAARDSTDMTKGAVVGGGTGAVFGAIVSSKSSKGALRGGALGAVVGGAVGASKKNDIYKSVYDECMRGK